MLCKNILFLQAILYFFLFLSDWKDEYDHEDEKQTLLPTKSKPPSSDNIDPVDPQNTPSKNLTPLLPVTNGLTTPNTTSTSVNNKIHPSTEQNSKLLITLVLILSFAVIGLPIIIGYLWNRQIKKKRQLNYSAEYQEEGTQGCENRELSTGSGSNTTEEETLLSESKLQEEEGRSSGTVPCDVLQVNIETHVQSSKNLRAPRAQGRSRPVEQADGGIKST